MHARSCDSFTFASDPDQHICELQLVHAGMLRARMQCNAHSAYSKFRSALELLETFELAPGAAKETKTQWRKGTEAPKAHNGCVQTHNEFVQAHNEFVQAHEDEYKNFLARYAVAVGITAHSPTKKTEMTQLRGRTPPMEVFEKLQREVVLLQEGRRNDQAEYQRQLDLMKEGCQKDQAEYQQQLDLVNQKLQRFKRIVAKISK